MARLGVAFSGGLPPADIVECVKLAEALGYESAWVAEGHGGDQFAILGACAVATRRILLGTSISSVFVRSATTMGMAAATLYPVIRSIAPPRPGDQEVRDASPDLHPQNTWALLATTLPAQAIGSLDFTCGGSLLTSTPLAFLASV